MDDVKTDLSLAMGGITRTNRYKRDLEKVKSILSQYPDEKVDYTGHSLGGTIAIEMNRLDPSSKAVVFNAGHTPFRNGSVKHKDITFYTKKGDVVSGLGANSYKNVKYLDSDDNTTTFLHSHSMDNFKDDNEKGDVAKDEEGGSFEGYDNVKGVSNGMLGAGLADIKKMKKHLNSIRGADTINDKVKHIKNMMKDAHKITHNKLRTDMLNTAGGILTTL